jgi:hypothetical protein
MIHLHERYITDAQGERIAVVLDLDAYEQLMALLEDIEDRDAVRAYDAAKVGLTDDDLIPWEQAKAELEAQWAAEEQPAG